jgi:hypothetical protein
MKTHLQILPVLHTRRHANRTHRAFAACFFSLTLLLSNRWCLAQNCPSTGAVIIDTANEETLASSINPIQPALRPS